MAAHPFRGPWSGQRFLGGHFVSARNFRAQRNVASTIWSEFLYIFHRCHINFKNWNEFSVYRALVSFPEEIKSHLISRVKRTALNAKRTYYFILTFLKILTFNLSSISKRSSPALFVQQIEFYWWPLFLCHLLQLQNTRLFNHPDLVGVFPILFENPESRSICVRDRKISDFDSCSEIFKWILMILIQWHHTEYT